MIRKIVIFFCVCVHTVLFADSIYLVNDADFTLTAVVEDAAGNILAETDINSQDSIDWSKNYQYFGFRSDVQAPRVPYKVSWYCPNGELYGVCTGVTPDTTVRARSCLGARRCRRSKL